MAAPGTGWAERIEPGEQARHAEAARALVAMQQAKSQRFGTGRALHRKPIVALKGTLRVLDDPLGGDVPLPQVRADRLRFDGEDLLALSERACASLSTAQKTTIERSATLLPLRVPSNVDALLNAGGAALGAALAGLLDWTGWLLRWRRLRPWTNWRPTARSM